MAGPGKARRGLVGQGMARPGMARLGLARQGMAGFSFSLSTTHYDEELT